MGWVIIGLLVAPVIRAEVPDHPRDDSLALLRSMLWDPRPERRFQYNVAATLDSGLQVNDASRAQLGLTVAAELSLIKYCRHLNVGGHASLSYLVGTQLAFSAEQWASVCLARHQFPLPGVELGHRLQWQATRRLSAPLRDPSPVASQESVFVFLSLFEPTSKDRTHRLSFVPMRLDFDIHLPNDRPLFPQVETGVLRYAWDSDPHRLALDVLFARYQSNGETQAADTMAFELFSGRLRLSCVEFGADLGLTLGTLGTNEATSATSSHTEVKRSENAITAGASVAVTRGSVKLGAGWARRMWPLPRQGLVLEQRLTGFLTWRPSGRRWLVEFEGFAARSTAFQIAQDRTEWIGGGELRWAHALGRWFQVGVSAEAARSYYASPVTSESPEIDGTPRFGLRAMGFVAVQLHNAD